MAVESLQVLADMRSGRPGPHPAAGPIELVVRYPPHLLGRWPALEGRLEAQLLAPVRVDGPPPGLTLFLRQPQAAQVAHDVRKEGRVMGDEEAGVGQFLREPPSLVEERAGSEERCARAQDVQDLFSHGFQGLQALGCNLAPGQLLTLTYFVVQIFKINFLYLR